MTKVTIIIHEGRGGRGPAGRMSRRHGRTGAGDGHRHEHGRRPGGYGRHGRPEEQIEGRDHGHCRHGMGHGRPDEQTEVRGHRRHGHDERHYGHRHGDYGQHAPGSPTDEQRQLARRLRRQMRHLMQEAEAAGLSPERVERIARREGRRSYL